MLTALMEQPCSSFNSYGTGRYLIYGITQCYLPPDTSECARLYPRQ